MDQKLATRVVELGDRSVMVGYQEYQGKQQFTLRYLYEDRNTHELLPGKNGITMPAENLIDAIELMLAEYNNMTGTNLVLADWLSASGGVE